MSRWITVGLLFAALFTLVRIEGRLARIQHEQTFANCMAMAERGVLCDAARDAKRPAKASRAGGLI